MFQKAIKKKAKLRILLEGASGCGKTYSALMIAKSIGSKIALIDTEKSSSALYSDKFDFDICELNPPFSPEKYIEAINMACKLGYDVLIIDSLTHEWSGEGGCLDIQTGLGGRFTDWAKVTPRHNKFINAIISAPIHIIATARAKSDYVIDVSSGKPKPSKVGMKSEQRDGLEFEFTTVLRLNQNNFYTASKDRTGLFTNEDIVSEETGKTLLNWLENGVEVKLPADIYKEKIEECNNIDELKNIWVSMDNNLKSLLLDIKDKKRMELSKNEEMQKVVA